MEVIKMESIAERFYAILETIPQQPVNPKSALEQLVMLKIIAARLGLGEASDFLDKNIKDDVGAQIDLVIDERIEDITTEQEFAATKVAKDSLIPAYNSETYDRVIIELVEIRERLKAQLDR